MATNEEEESEQTIVFLENGETLDTRIDRILRGDFEEGTSASDAIEDLDLR